jgi:hypothetical protein
MSASPVTRSLPSIRKLANRMGYTPGYIPNRLIGSLPTTGSTLIGRFLTTAKFSITLRLSRLALVHVAWLQPKLVATTYQRERFMNEIGELTRSIDKTIGAQSVGTRLACQCPKCRGTIDAGQRSELREPWLQALESSRPKATQRLCSRSPTQQWCSRATYEPCQYQERPAVQR